MLSRNFTPYHDPRRDPRIEGKYVAIVPLPAGAAMPADAWSPTESTIVTAGASPIPSPTPTPTASPAATAAPTASPTPSPSPTEAPTASPSPTDEPTATPSEAPTAGP